MASMLLRSVCTGSVSNMRANMSTSSSLLLPLRSSSDTAPDDSSSASSVSGSAGSADSADSSSASPSSFASVSATPDAGSSATASPAAASLAAAGSCAAHVCDGADALSSADVCIDAAVAGVTFSSTSVCFAPISSAAVFRVSSASLSDSMRISRLEFSIAIAYQFNDYYAS